MSNFWTKLKRPIVALAPLANVTDAVFRGLIARYGKPDVMFTEFVSCDGLVSAGRQSLLIDLKYSELERPIVAQFFGARADNFYECAKLAGELGFDGIDINMGCPDRAVEKQGAGAALINNPKLAQAIIKETKRGAGGLPVSVKTRLGYNQDSLDAWLPQLLETELAAIIIHARTRKEMSAVDAHWDRVAEAVKIRNAMGTETLILGNGDVKDVPEAELKIQETGADGVMIGRGVFGNPWLFSRERDCRSVGLEEKLSVMLEHTLLFEKLFTGVKNFDVMKKHYKVYVTGWDGARELRARLMEAKNAVEVERITNKFLSLRAVAKQSH